MILALAPLWMLGTRAFANPDLHVNLDLTTCTIQFDESLTQAQFDRFAAEAGLTPSYLNGGSAATLGRGGVQAGLVVAKTRVDQWSGAWNNTFQHPYDEHYLGDVISFPKIQVRVGAADNVDLGALFTIDPQSGMVLVGGEGKLALWTERSRGPDLAVHGSYAHFLGIQDVSLASTTVDLVASQHFWHLAPYLGLAEVYTSGRPHSDVVELEVARSLSTQAIGGVEVDIGMLRLGTELALARVPTWSLKAAATF